MMPLDNFDGYTPMILQHKKTQYNHMILKNNL